MFSYERLRGHQFLRWRVVLYFASIATLSLSCQAATPTNITTNPSSGQAIAQTFAVSATDSAGWQDINRVMFMIYATSSSTCVAEIFPSTNQLYLMTADASSWLGPITAGSGSLNNNLCTLYGSGSSYSGGGNTVTADFSLAFSSSFAGTWPIYGAALDNAYNSSGWSQTGTFTTAPTITGVNSFWWLGGLLSDGNYYAQAAWTANANGASGTPTWHTLPIYGGGNVSFSCMTCSSTTATSTAPSNGCYYDLTVYVTYPDGSQSTNFNVAIITPSTTTLLSGYPQDEGWFAPYGYQSVTSWNLTDTCGSSDAGLDGHEAFGSFSDDYAGNSWGHPTPNGLYNSTSHWADTIGNAYEVTPPSIVPQSPLGSTAIFHSPWSLWVGSQALGSFGVSVRSDTAQVYQDHGRHQ